MKSISTIIPLLALLITFAHASAQPTLPFKSRELQEGKHFISSSIAIPEVSEASGQARETFAFHVPKGRGVTPVVQMEYSSSGNASEYGHGWELSIPVIERSRRFGVPTSNTDLFRYRVGHAQHELVPTGVFTLTGGVEYKERVETTFNRYIRYDNRWVLLSRNGVRYEFGTNWSSRAGTNRFQFSGTFAWYVERIIDSNNNFASYEYEQDSVDNPRIHHIYYNGNSAVFNLPAGLSIDFTWAWTAAADTEVRNDYASGYRRVFGKDSLIQVQIGAQKHQTTGPAVVPTSSPETLVYYLYYSNPAATLNRTFYLLRIDPPGIPEITYAYNNPWDSTSALITIDTGLQTYEQGVGAPFAFPGHLGNYEADGDTTRTRSALVAPDGTGRMFLVSSKSDSCGPWHLWGTGDGNGIYHSQWDPPLDPLAPLDPCALRVEVNEGGALSKTVQDFLDLNGDSLPDLVYTTPGGVSKFCPGTGSGFGECGLFGGPVITALRAVDTSFGNIQRTTTDLIDVNGDGRPDFVKVNGSDLHVHLNLGNQFSSTPLISPMPWCPGFPSGVACLRVTRTISQYRQLLADIRDVNGDGLPDYIWSDEIDSKLYVAFGTGSGFATPTFSGLTQMLGFSIQVSDFSRNIADLVDVNGDRLPDFLNRDCTTDTYTVRFNNGGNWDSAVQTYRASQSEGSENFEVACTGSTRANSAGGRTVSAFVDMTGDGLPDFVSAPIDGSLITNHFAVRKLQSRVGQRSIQSIASNNDHHVAILNYEATLAAAPFAVTAVSSVFRDRTELWPGEAARHTRANTFYLYGGGVYNPTERAFMGFITVSRVGPLWESALMDDIHGETVTTNYGTTVANQGAIQSRLAWNNGSVAPSVQEYEANTYATVALDAGRTWLRRDHYETQSRDVGLSLTRSHLTDFITYDAFGQPTEWYERGDSTTSADDIVNLTSYVTRSDEEFIIHVPSDSIRGYAYQLGPRPETRYYYDDRSTLGALPTQGNLVKVERQRESGTFVNTQRFYDALGNLTSEQNETGFTTNHSYDATYQLFPVTSTNSVGTTHRSFHALYGSVADECGPQYSGSSYNCKRVEIDLLGRPSRSWSSDLVNNTYQLVQRSSVAYDDVSYPTAVTLTDSFGARQIEYRDGFGNPVSLRVEESTNAFRVYESAYDPMGRPLRTELARRESGTAFSHAVSTVDAWTYEHDTVHGFLRQITNPRDPGGSCQAGCDVSSSRSRLIDRVVLTDEDGRAIEYVLDGQDRVARIDEVGSTGTSTTSFVYDQSGNIGRVTDPTGLITTYERNLLGWITAVTPPSSQPYSYSHNPRGQVTSLTDPRGATSSWDYDAAGRLTSIDSLGGSRDVHATLTYYDASIDSKQIGGLRTETSDSITYTYSYNPHGHVTSHAVDSSPSSGSVQFAYDGSGRLSHVTYPPSSAPYIVDYAYDLAGQVTQVTGPNGLVLASYLYEDDGQVSSTSNDLGLIESNSYDVRRRLVGIASSNSNIMSGDLVDDRLDLSNAGDVVTLHMYGLKPGLAPRSVPDTFVRVWIPS